MWQQTSGQVATMVTRGVRGILLGGMGRGVEQSKQNSQTKTNQEKRQRQKAPTLSTSSSSMFEERNIKKKKLK